MMEHWASANTVPIKRTLLSSDVQKGIPFTRDLAEASGAKLLKKF
jgi:hypothetical protein